MTKHPRHTKTHPHIQKHTPDAGAPAKGFRKESQRITQAGVGALTKRLSKRKPTDNASWGGGPSKKKCKTHFYGQRKLGWTQQSEVHFNVIESTGIPANQKVLYIKEAQRGFLISNHLCAIILEFMSYPVHRL